MTAKLSLCLMIVGSVFLSEGSIKEDIDHPPEHGDMEGVEGIRQHLMKVESDFNDKLDDIKTNISIQLTQDMRDLKSRMRTRIARIHRRIDARFEILISEYLQDHLIEIMSSYNFGEELNTIPKLEGGVVQNQDQIIYLQKVMKDSADQSKRLEANIEQIKTEVQRNGDDIQMIKRRLDMMDKTFDANGTVGGDSLTNMTNVTTERTNVLAVGRYYSTFWEISLDDGQKRNITWTQAQIADVIYDAETGWIYISSYYNPQGVFVFPIDSPANSTIISYEATDAIALDHEQATLFATVLYPYSIGRMSKNGGNFTMLYTSSTGLLNNIALDKERQLIYTRRNDIFLEMNYEGVVLRRFSVCENVWRLALDSANRLLYVVDLDNVVRSMNLGTGEVKPVVQINHSIYDMTCYDGKLFFGGHINGQVSEFDPFKMNVSLLATVNSKYINVCLIP